ncbi:hypothetical protein [Microbacterium aurantiacum]|uniref:hypothetical protein n=1 Tax=Microbacterium aurantiacum TaxID=162393 RepID=UPI001F16AADB|nr:hypothetical protein [Microbacterium aurantiacum]
MPRRRAAHALQSSYSTTEVGSAEDRSRESIPAPIVNAFLTANVDDEEDAS